MKTSTKGKDLLKTCESFRAFAYPDPVSPLAKATPGKRWGFKRAQEILDTLDPQKAALSGAPWTVGYGQTKGVNQESAMSVSQAEADLFEKLPRYEKLVLASCTVMPTQSQFDALVCIAWNVEVAVSKQSAIIKAHNRRDFASAAKAFTLYNKAGGQVNEGLTRRRRREADLYLTPEYEETVADPMLELSAQSVDEPKSLTASKINMAQAGTATVATLTGVTEVAKTVGEFKDTVTSLGEWLVPLACLVIIGFALYTAWERYDLRKRGVV